MSIKDIQIGRVTFHKLPSDKINIVPGNNVRQVDKKHVDYLAGLIGIHGFDDAFPLVVSKNKEGTYDLQQGEHRLRAVRQVEKEKGIQIPVPVKIQEKDQALLTLGNVISNSGKTMNQVEIGEAVYRAMQEDPELDQKGAAEILNVSSAYISQALKLVEVAPEEARDLVKQDKLSAANLLKIVSRVKKPSSILEQAREMSKARGGKKGGRKKKTEVPSENGEGVDGQEVNGQKAAPKKEGLNAEEKQAVIDLVSENLGEEWSEKLKVDLKM